MEKKPYPSETQERFIIRLPDGMRDLIAEEAKKNKRSMNAEIVARLQASFDAPPSELSLARHNRLTDRLDSLVMRQEMLRTQMGTLSLRTSFVKREMESVEGRGGSTKVYLLDIAEAEKSLKKLEAQVSDIEKEKAALLKEVLKNKLDLPRKEAKSDH